MKCPFCGYRDSRVLESRSTEEGSAIRRRRECLSCRERFTTYERVETIPLMVIKKDGTRQEFDRSKILQGLIKACEKRAVPLSRLEELVSGIEQTLRNSMEQEVSSHTIGEMVMEELRRIDQVAYVRFASVYRQFRDIQSFLKSWRRCFKRKSPKYIPSRRSFEVPHTSGKTAEPRADHPVERHFRAGLSRPLCGQRSR